MSRLNVILLMVFVGLLVWITMFDSTVVERIQRGAMSIFGPSIESSEKLSSVTEVVEENELTISEMKAKLTSLESERDSLRLEVLQLDEIIEENNDLRKALQYKERAPLSLVPARILSRKPSNWYNTVIIDKGIKEGVVQDSPVIVSLDEKAALVGKVSEVLGDHTAVVLLLTDEMCQVSAKLENTKEEGIITGQRGTLRTKPNLKLRYLSKEIEAKPGHRVVSSGAGELFPPNLILGEVVRLKVGVIDAEAVVKPSIDFDSIKDIFVVILDQKADGAVDGEDSGGGDKEEGKKAVSALPKN